jgi:gamma-glutamyl:cysteine ligase YbdK (ATP-grasp superfamily)
MNTQKERKPRRGLIDQLLRLALRPAYYLPALEVRILDLILRRERKRRGIR